jgi:hypothetical protein
MEVIITNEERPVNKKILSFPTEEHHTPAPLPEVFSSAKGFSLSPPPAFQAVPRRAVSSPIFPGSAILNLCKSYFQLVIRTKLDCHRGMITRDIQEELLRSAGAHAPLLSPPHRSGFFLGFFVDT